MRQSAGRGFAMKTTLKSFAAICLSAQIVAATQMATVAQAEMISTDAAIQKYSSQYDRAFLLSEIERKEIRDEIIRLGVDPNEAEARLQALSDAEVASILTQMEKENAGGDGVIGVLFTVFIILLVTDILCLTRIFNFTRCVR